MVNYLGGTPITSVYLGATPIQGIYLGTTPMFASGPGFSSVSPTQAAAGTSITITGSGFSAGTASVTIGGTAATSVSVSSDTSLTCTVPTLARGSQDIVITVAGVSTTATGAFFVQTPPTVAYMDNTSGGAGLGVFVSGTNFFLPAIITLGGVQVDGLTIINSNSLVFAVPTLATTGAKDFEVATSDGRYLVPSVFTYYNGPTISSVSPSSGNIGAFLTINGTNLVQGDTTVTIGGLNATLSGAGADGGGGVVLLNSINCIVPSGLTNNTTYNVVVTTPAGSATRTNAFTYVIPAPTFSSISPVTGKAGSVVTVTGTGFVPSATTVTIGGLNTTGVSVSSSTSLTCTVPSGLANNTAYNVVVTTAGGSATGTGAFTNYNAPTYTGVSPTTGVPGGTVTISGTNFVTGTTVTIGGTAATGVSVSPPTSLTCTVPSLTAGAKSIVITTPGGTVTGAGVFTVVGPTYSGISVPQGKAGLVVTVTGANFASGMTATVGGVAAACTYVSATSCTVTIPTIGTEGAKSIVLTTASGSATGTNVFTYYNTYAAATTTYSTAGSGTYSIPAWANRVDVVCMGGGGGGGGSSFTSWGAGGSGGTYGSTTLVRGTSITWGTTTLAYTVGAGGGPGDFNPVSAGKAGTASTGAGTVTGPGGTGGLGANNGVAGSNGAAVTVNSVTYPASIGAVAGTQAAPDAAFGSGGGGGRSAGGPYAGVAGRAGAVYFRAYQ